MVVFGRKFVLKSLSQANNLFVLGRLGVMCLLAKEVMTVICSYLM